MAGLPPYYETPSKRPVLGYWAIRGLGQPLRNLLKYVGADFEEVLYGDDGKPDWTADKPIQPTSFPNLPYFFDTNGVKLVQSSAILRYLGRKYGLTGKSEEEQAIVDMCCEQVVDWRTAVVDLSYNKDFPFGEVYKNDIIRHADLFEKHAAKYAGKWIAGSEEPTIADFLLYEILDVSATLVKEKANTDFFAERPHLKALHRKFEELTPIKEYFASSSYIRRPINSPPYAAWY